jgi:hypothetical protein
VWAAMLLVVRLVYLGRWTSNRDQQLVPALRPSGATVTIARASFMSFRQSVATSRPYEHNGSLRIDRKGRPRTDA